MQKAEQTLTRPFTLAVDLYQPRLQRLHALEEGRETQATQKRNFLYRYKHKHAQLPKQTEKQKDRAAGRVAYSTLANATMKEQKEIQAAH